MRHHRHLQASPSYYHILSLPKSFISNVVVCARGVPPELPFKVCEEAASCEFTAVPSPDIRLGEMHEQNEGSAAWESVQIQVL